MLSNCGSEEEDWESLGQWGTKPVNPKGNQPWIFIRRTDAEAEALILQPDVELRCWSWSSNTSAWSSNTSAWCKELYQGSLVKTLMLGKTKERRRGQQRMRWLDGITDSMDMRLNKLQEIVKDRKVWCAVVHGISKSWTWLSDWTTPPPTLRIPPNSKRGLAIDTHSIVDGSQGCYTKWKIANWRSHSV